MSRRTPAPRRGGGASITGERSGPSGDGVRVPITGLPPRFAGHERPARLQAAARVPDKEPRRFGAVVDGQAHQVPVVQRRYPIAQAMPRGGGGLPVISYREPSPAQSRRESRREGIARLIGWCRIERDRAGAGRELRGHELGHASCQDLRIARRRELADIRAIRPDCAGNKRCRGEERKAEACRAIHRVPSRVMTTRVWPLPTPEISSARSSTRSTTYRLPSIR